MHDLFPSISSVETEKNLSTKWTTIQKSELHFYGVSKISRQQNNHVSTGTRNQKLKEKGNR